MFTHKNILTQLKLDEAIIETKIYNLTIGVCLYKGGGFRMSPNAIPNDGMLDVTLASSITRSKLIASLPKIIGETQIKSNTLNFFR